MRKRFRDCPRVRSAGAKLSLSTRHAAHDHEGVSNNSSRRVLFLGGGGPERTTAKSILPSPVLGVLSSAGISRRKVLAGSRHSTRLINPIVLSANHLHHSALAPRHDGGAKTFQSSKSLRSAAIVILVILSPQSHPIADNLCHASSLFQTNSARPNSRRNAQ